MSILKTTVIHDSVNNDSNLHVFVTKYYYNKTKYWIKHSDKFNKYKDINFKSRRGNKFHTLIKLFIYKKLNTF